MRLRHGIIALCLAASLTACGGDDEKDASSTASTSAASTSEPVASLDPSDIDTAKCAKFLEGQAEAAKLASKLTPGSNVVDAIAAANAQFDALREGAPEEIREALDGLKAAYTLLGKFYSDPSSMTAAAAADIEKASKDLQENALKLNNYIVENCS